MKNSNETIGNRTRDLPACSAVSQPTAPPRAPLLIDTYYFYNFFSNLIKIACMCTKTVIPRPTAEGGVITACSTKRRSAKFLWSKDGYVDWDIYGAHFQ